METIESTKDGAIIRLSSAELIILSNALNEICNGISIWEFETRIGYSREEVEKLFNQIHQIPNWAS